MNRRTGEPCPVIPLFPGSDPMPEPGSGFAAIAADFRALGVTPDQILSLPGLRPSTALELSMAIAILEMSGLPAGRPGPAQRPAVRRPRHLRSVGGAR